MQALPHHYLVEGALIADRVDISAQNLTTIESEPPAEFGGSGTRWSPETLLLAAVSDCFLLTFKAIACASKFSYSDIKCEVEGRLDRVDGVTRFTKITVRPTLKIESTASTGEISDEQLEKSTKSLHKAEKGCLVSNSLNSKLLLEPCINTCVTTK
ncbi:MAG: peroxiredoxin-like protein [Candidatus Azotimanducaceae bacterium]|jgi:peroxiredoxin-like protein